MVIAIIILKCRLSGRKGPPNFGTRIPVTADMAQAVEMIEGVNNLSHRGFQRTRCSADRSALDPSRVRYCISFVWRRLDFFVRLTSVVTATRGHRGLSFPAGVCGGASGANAGLTVEVRRRGPRVRVVILPIVHNLRASDDEICLQDAFLRVARAAAIVCK